MVVMSGTRIRAKVTPTDRVLPGFIGVLMLDTRFPRPLGDIGNPQSFTGEVRHLVVHGAWPNRVVASAQALRESGLAQTFCGHARELVSAGARAITTSCGFLVLLQDELQLAVKVPVVTSSLLQLPRLLDADPQVGVLTISAQHLGREHLLAAGVAPERLDDVVVQGVEPSSEFASAILGNRETMDLRQARAEVVAAALALKARAPGLREVVLECTNMPPYAEAIAEATGFRLHSLLDAEELVSPAC
jgi:hypothetical protein